MPVTSVTLHLLIMVILEDTQSKHKGVKYGCNQCDYRASQQGGITAHMKSIHEGVKYDCNQCEYRATWKISLTNHMRSIHEGMIYGCNQCSYGAYTQSNLTSHIHYSLLGKAKTIELKAKIRQKFWALSEPEAFFRKFAGLSTLMHDLTNY